MTLFDLERFPWLDWRWWFPWGRKPQYVIAKVRA